MQHYNSQMYVHPFKDWSDNRDTCGYTFRKRNEIWEIINHDSMISNLLLIRLSIGVLLYFLRILYQRQIIYIGWMYHNCIALGYMSPSTKTNFLWVPCAWFPHNLIQWGKTALMIRAIPLLFFMPTWCEIIYKNRLCDDAFAWNWYY